MSVDLTGDIAAAVNGAVERGRTLVLAYVDADGYPATSYRGSLLVLGPTRLGLWARDPEGGLVASLAERPKVSLLFYERGGPGPFFLSLRGQAAVDPSANDAVWDGMVALELRP